MVLQNSKKDITLALRDYFEKRKDVLMAFLFGSWANDQEGIESDVDIAIYFKGEKNSLEWENSSFFSENEATIWREIERIVQREVDLLVLNRTPATIADSALQGIPILIKDHEVYMDFLLRITSEAVDFREWVNDYWKLKEKRSHGNTAGR
jgi:hypothetical protein